MLRTEQMDFRRVVWSITRACSQSTRRAKWERKSAPKRGSRIAATTKFQKKVRLSSLERRARGHSPKTCNGRPSTELRFSGEGFRQSLRRFTHVAGSMLTAAPVSIRKSTTLFWTINAAVKDLEWAVLLAAFTDGLSSLNGLLENYREKQEERHAEYCGWTG